MLKKLPSHKTKIVCTVGPASRSRKMLKKMMQNGMNVARLNFSHGDPQQHRDDIRAIREVAAELNSVVAIVADLPGPKIRIGRLENGSINLKKGQRITLTTRDVLGNDEVVPVQFRDFCGSVRKGNVIYLNDGFIQMKVVAIEGEDVLCRVIIGGQLLSNKGINLPDSSLTVDPVTERDLKLVDFGLSEGVDAFCVSFAREARDIRKVRDFADGKGRRIFIVAKIERKEALENIDEILHEADGLMIARGDLGVEIPIEKVPVVQKNLIHKANLASRPVITATQMLESMTDNIRPTRAEVTDVANAILDGTDAVMLSEETAIGKYPADACNMLRKIARATDAKRDSLVSAVGVRAAMMESIGRRGVCSEDVLSLDVIEALKTLNIRYVLAPTESGGTPRRISRYKNDTWILGFCCDEHTRNLLMLSYGVWPIMLDAVDDDARLVEYLKSCAGLKAGERVLIARRIPDATSGKENSLKIITLPKAG